jgi:hypothetical protein
LKNAKPAHANFLGVNFDSTGRFPERDLFGRNLFENLQNGKNETLQSEPQLANELDSAGDATQVIPIYDQAPLGSSVKTNLQL